MSRAVLSAVMLCLALPGLAIAEQSSAPPYAPDGPAADGADTADGQAEEDAQSRARRTTMGERPGNPQNRLVVSGTNEYLVSGSTAIRMGQFDEGIRLMEIGITDFEITPRQRAAALNNICAAYAGKREPDNAIDYCSRSLEVNATSWRPYSNRAFAYYLKGMYGEAAEDLEAAAAISPDQPQIEHIRELINERTLEPHVTVEDHQ